MAKGADAEAIENFLKAVGKLEEELKQRGTNFFGGLFDQLLGAIRVIYPQYSIDLYISDKIITSICTVMSVRFLTLYAMAT